MNRLFRIFLAAFFVTSIVGCTTAPRMKKQDVRTAITLEWRERTLCVDGMQVRTCFVAAKVQ